MTKKELQKALEEAREEIQFLREELRLRRFNVNTYPIYLTYPEPYVYPQYPWIQVGAPSIRWDHNQYTEVPIDGIGTVIQEDKYLQFS